MRFKNEPNGLAEAFIIGEEFIRNDNVAWYLEIILFCGYRFSQSLKKSCAD